MSLVFITGSSGLIGRPLVQMLLERGDAVYSFDKALDSHHDILEKAVLTFQITNYKPDVIIHLAAQSGVEAARSHARASWELNVLGTLNVLEAARLGNTPVVLASSNHVYGHQDTDARTDESAPMNQLDTYSATKIAADVMGRSYWHNYGLPVVVVRNTNCYGPESPHLDHLIEGTIVAALKDEQIQMRTDGQTSKAYLYVDDVARAYMLIADQLMDDNLRGEAINVTGDEWKAINVVGQVLYQMGKPELMPILGPPLDDQEDEHLDDSKIRAFGWQPDVPLERGIHEMIAAFTERYGGVVA
jgi:nucleoside-diphosphate-sugar epimerase